MFLAQVCARVCMCVLKSIIKVLAIFKTLPGNIYAFLNLTVCQVCWFGIKSTESEVTLFEVAGINKKNARMQGIYDCLLKVVIITNLEQKQKSA